MTFERFFETELDGHVQRYQQLAGYKLEKPERKTVRAHFRTSKAAVDNARQFYRLIHA